MVLRDLSLERLQDREQLRKAVDNLRRDIEPATSLVLMNSPASAWHSVFLQLAQALDLSDEDPRTLERYGKPDPEWADGAPKMTTSFLMARRLVEAGARYVSLNFSRWDWHSNNFDRGRTDIPMLDNVCMLVEDLHERSRQGCTVVCWGEFGRTPKINAKAGRDHWPKANFCLLAGGGLRTGQVIGSTDKHAAEPNDRPVKFHEVHATLLHNLGVSPNHDRIFDLRGRPQYPLPHEIKPLKALV